METLIKNVYYQNSFIKDLSKKQPEISAIGIDDNILLFPGFFVFGTETKMKIYDLYKFIQYGSNSLVRPLNKTIINNRFSTKLTSVKNTESCFDSLTNIQLLFEILSKLSFIVQDGEKEIYNDDRTQKIPDLSKFSKLCQIITLYDSKHYNSAYLFKNMSIS